ncbi:hypothetical protein [uncultured Sphingomonas sp.]|mgnify:CR=1 FL=1|uniref:phage tail termination protein n=1 Tax=uncultured Sphingomonas sp. TaxID=158754 RepID=UPI0025917CFC|nr:hypothetical protein [uncultured Sphingomonas sp.]
MNLAEELRKYLTPAAPGIELCLGPWSDERKDARKRYLSVNFDGGQRPGVISKTRNIDLWFATEQDVRDVVGGVAIGYATASQILEYIEDHPASSCFANVIPIAGIIGPKDTEHKRQAYYIPIEITY